jgi:hypothetical protein
MVSQVVERGLQVPENPLLVVFHGRVFSHSSLTGVLRVHLLVLIITGVGLVLISECLSPKTRAENHLRS